MRRPANPSAARRWLQLAAALAAALYILAHALALVPQPASVARRASAAATAPARMAESDAAPARGEIEPLLPPLGSTAVPAVDAAEAARRALATDPAEAARQAAWLASLLTKEFSRKAPFAQERGRMPVAHFASPRHAVAEASARGGGSVCARGRGFFASFTHNLNCEICDEHAHSARYLFDRFFGASAGSAWERRGVYVESGALDGSSGAHSLFFDEVMNWRGLLIEANPPNFARLLARRPHATRLECALCETDEGGRQVEFVGDYGGVVGSAAAMGDGLRAAFHGDREDRYNVSCCAMRTYWPLLDLGPRIDIWFLDVEGSELGALRSVDWHRTAVWLILVEMNPAAGAATLAAVRDYLVRERGFELVTELGEMNELYEHAGSRPPRDEGTGVAGSDASVCDMGEKHSERTRSLTK